MGITRTRIAVSVSASIAVVAAVAGTAGARIPEGDFGTGVQARPAVVALPDAIDRAMKRHASTLEVGNAGPDAVARAIARRSR